VNYSRIIGQVLRYNKPVPTKPAPPRDLSLIIADGLLPTALLRIEDLFHSTDDGGLDFIQTVHHLFYAWSIDRLDFQLGLFCFGQKLAIDLSEG
jgi:hypothetical protein